MNIKTVENIEREDPSEETLALTKRWREITKLGDYRYTHGQWKRYNHPRTLKAEQKKIEVELWQRNKLLRQRPENTANKETAEIERKREFHRVMNKIRPLPKSIEAGPSTSNTRKTQPEDYSFETETPGSPRQKHSHPILTIHSQNR